MKINSIIIIRKHRKFLNQSKKEKIQGEYHFLFFKNDDTYVLAFDGWENTFIDDFDLYIWKNIFHIRRKKEQNLIEYNKKTYNPNETMEDNIENEKMLQLTKMIYIQSKKDLEFRFLSYKDISSILLNEFQETK